jgi:hypothetical protein
MNINLSDEAEKLEQFMIEGHGRFALGFVRYINRQDNEKIINSIKIDLSQKNIFLKVLDFENEHIENFLSSIARKRVRLKGVDTPCIIITGLESSIMQDPKKRLLRNLNLDRDRIRREISAPLVLWLRSDAYLTLCEAAPDFCDYWMARFDFTSFLRLSKTP